VQYSLVCFDLDGTIVDDTVFIWTTLHEHFKTDQGRRNKARDDFYAGRISYKEWFDHDLVLLDEAGATREKMVEAIGKLSLIPGALETLTQLRAEGRSLAIISGSIDLVVETLDLGHLFDAMLINHVRFGPDGRLNGGVHTPYDIEKKGEGLLHLSETMGLPPERVAFVGDNSNDLSAARAAGLSVAFNCKSDELRELADVEVAERDLRAVLPHLI